MNGPKGINSKINASGPFMAQLVDFCVRYRATWVRRGYNTPIMNRLIFAKFKALVGGNVRVLLSGGAPLAEESHQFIRTALCTAVHQGKLTTYIQSNLAIRNFLVDLKLFLKNRSQG